MLCACAMTDTSLRFQIDALEQNALEVLCMTRSIKNALAPINQVPPEVISLIPDYCETEEELIALTHVCRSWREIFISRASLWTFLDCTDLDKTNAYIQRSRGSPLEISFAPPGLLCRRDAFDLTLPFIGRFKALTLSGFSRNIIELTKHLGTPAPLLDKLDIQVRTPDAVTNEGILFGGDLSSLRELCLHGIIPDLPWQNMTNVTTFDFRHAPEYSITTTQLLNFFEHAPLCEITLVESFPHSSDAPAERTVSLPHLKLFRIRSFSPHSAVLNHLHIPIGALVTMEFELDSDTCPIQHHFPRSLDNLGNISHITSINLDFYDRMSMRLQGPSGGLYALGFCDGIPDSLESEHLVLQSLRKFPISTIERFTMGFLSVDTENGGPVYQTLLLMENLRTLVLGDFDHTSFVSALNPNRNASNVVICPKLEELSFIIESPYINEISEMAKVRALRGAKLATVVIFSAEEFIPAGVFDLESHVSRVEYKSYETEPRWDFLPGEDEDDGYDSSW